MSKANHSEKAKEIKEEIQEGVAPEQPARELTPAERFAALMAKKRGGNIANGAKGKTENVQVVKPHIKFKEKKRQTP